VLGDTTKVTYFGDEVGFSDFHSGICCRVARVNEGKNPIAGKNPYICERSLSTISISDVAVHM